MAMLGTCQPCPALRERGARMLKARLARSLSLAFGEPVPLDESRAALSPRHKLLKLVAIPLLRLSRARLLQIPRSDVGLSCSWSAERRSFM